MNQLIAEAGCANVQELRLIDAAKLFETWQNVKKSEKKLGMSTAPSIDGIVLTEPPLETANRGAQKDIPYMIGSTRQDIFPPFISGMSKKWCIRQDEQKKQPSYCWFFDRKLPGDDNGAWHSSELWYFFGTLKNGWRPFTEHDYQISDAMATALCNFAKTGNPNEKGSDLWKPTTTAQKQMMVWGEKLPHMGKPSQLKLVFTMLTNKAVGE